MQRFFAKYTVFSGRASRSEYWWWMLVAAAVAVVFEIVFFSGMTATTTTLSSGARTTVPVPGPLSVVALVLMAIYVLATIVPSLALTVRRLHDGNFSGWMILLGLIPFVGGLILLVMTLLPSNPQGQRFGEGATAILRRGGSSTPVGLLVVSQRDPAGIDDEHRDLLTAVTPMFARIADDRGRIGLLRAEHDPATLALVVGPDGDSRPLDAAAAQFAGEAPQVVQEALRLFWGGPASRSGYAWHQRRWWRVVLARADDVSLSRPDVVVVTARPSAAPAGLTRRELQVLTLMAEGLANAGIAAQLGLSVRTVTTHVEHVLGTLDRPSRASCAARAESEGIRLLG